MPKHYRTITFKVFLESDADILDWWDAIDAGQRSDVLRDLIREHLGLPTQRKPKQIEVPELDQVHRDVLWIHEALNDMPAYLEGVLQRAASQGTAVNPARASPESSTEDTASLSKDDAQRRTRRMKRATW